MRILHLLVIVFFTAILLTIARDPVGRVAIVVFFTGLIEFVFGLMAIMTLFQTVGSFGHANHPGAYIEAILSTALVLLVSTVTMDGLLCIGIWLVQRAVD
jgi:hypothetical protein